LWSPEVDLSSNPTRDDPCCRWKEEVERRGEERSRETCSRPGQ